MTKSELALLQLKARVEAQEMALGAIVKSLCRDATQRQSLRRCIVDLRGAGSERPTPGLTAEYSMLLASETQDAFETLAAALLKYTEH